MVVLDGTIVDIALPYIQSDLDISIDNLRWVVTGYALAFGSLLLLGGRLGDLYGRRKVFMVGLVIFGVASLLGGLATNEGLLLAARGLQGLGAALASPAALALIATTFPAGPARNRAFAVYAAMSGVGAAVGLLLGGWLTGTELNLFRQGHRRLAAHPADRRPDRHRDGDPRPRLAAESGAPGELDLPGAVTGAPACSAWSTASAAPAPKDGETPGRSASLAAGIGLLGAFIGRGAGGAPAAPGAGLHQPHPAASFMAMFFAPAAMFAMFFYLSQYIQIVMGYARCGPASRSCRSASAWWPRPGSRRT